MCGKTVRELGDTGGGERAPPGFSDITRGMRLSAGAKVKGRVEDKAGAGMMSTNRLTRGVKGERKLQRKGRFKPDPRGGNSLKRAEPADSNRLRQGKRKAEKKD